MKKEVIKDNKKERDKEVSLDNLSQIKSTDRVRDLGEVFTNEREVCAMLDLVHKDKKMLEPSATYLEPACGHGNFLIKILERKLDNLKKKKLNKKDFDFNVAIAISSIYGIDIQEDNVIEARERILKYVRDFYKESKKVLDTDLEKAIKVILKKNIIVGDTINNPKDINFIEYKTDKKYNFIMSNFNITDDLVKGNDGFKNVFDFITDKEIIIPYLEIK